MNKEKQRIVIAEACGWTDIREDEHKYVDFDARSVTEWASLDGTKNGKRGCVPDYLNDLNAMYEAEKILNETQFFEYADWIRKIRDGHGYPVLWRQVHSTAEQRAEAFLRTIGKWE